MIVTSTEVISIVYDNTAVFKKEGNLLVLEEELLRNLKEVLEKVLSEAVASPNRNTTPDIEKGKVEANTEVVITSTIVEPGRIVIGVNEVIIIDEDINFKEDRTTGI